MLKFFIGLIATLSCDFMTINGNDYESKSFIAPITVEFQNGVWICDKTICPANTIGCRIQRKTDNDNETTLKIVNACLDDKKQIIASELKTVEMSEKRNIDIDVDCFENAGHDYSTSYGYRTEFAKGTVALDEWKIFKEAAQNNTQVVEKSLDDMNIK